MDEEHPLGGLEDIYPPATLAEIERRGRSSSHPHPSGLARRAAAGGLVAGLLLGVREVGGDPSARPEVVEIDPREIESGEGVRLLLFRDDPGAGRAWVKPGAG